jgi:serine/threonine-protein kinase
LTGVRERGQISTGMGEPIVIGLRLNNYEIISVIGEGGMGTVYLARHTFTGRKAAVKLLHPQLAQDQVLVTRFMNEARATAAIGHPNIIDIIDVGFLPDGLRPYLMMELLQGESLGKRLQREHPLPIHEAIEIAAQTAFALSAAHACGIVHRDLKPDNLFLVPDPAMPPLGMRVKVLDFGIAKLRGELSSGSVKTRTGTIMGTPQYMSPEQCRGLAEYIDQRTDIYTLGIIVYEMVCGSPPFVSEGLGDMLIMHLSNPPAPPRTLNPAVPEALEAAIMRALAKDPSQRFASMADFQEALRPGNLASAGTATQRAAGQSSVWETAARTGSVPAVSGSTALGTTLASSAGQFLPGQTESTRRRTHGARRAVMAGGVLLMAALGIYATVTFRGRLTTSATSAAPDRGAGTRFPTHLLPTLAPPDAARALVAPPDAAPLPEAAHATAVVVEEHPGKTKDKRPDKNGAKKHVARFTPLPLPLPLPEELPPSLPKESPLPLPKELPPPAPKKVERW